jgi:prophage maintenance system killer protein
MTTLDVADLVVIAGHVLGLDPDAVLDQLDVAAAEAALAEAEAARAEAALAEPARAGPLEAGPDGAGLAAAVLIRALLRHRPFPGHSQQVAAAAGLQLLALNGWQADLDPPGAAVVVVEGLASGRLSPADAAAWLSPRLSLYSAPPTWEAPMRTRLPRLLRAVDPRPQAGVRTPVTGFLPFTDDAHDVVVLARAEADRLGLDRPGSVQHLVALADTGQGVAAQVLRRLGLSPEAVRQQVAQVAAQHQPPARPEPDNPFSMWVMPRAVGEAVAHGHDYIGTEHILLGLFHAGDDTAAQALASLGAGEREVRATIAAVTGDPGPVRPAHHRGRKPMGRDDEVRRLRREVARLSDLLREHGIEPGTEPGESARKSA